MHNTTEQFPFPQGKVLSFGGGKVAMGASRAQQPPFPLQTGPGSYSIGMPNNNCMLFRLYPPRIAKVLFQGGNNANSVSFPLEILGKSRSGTDATKALNVSHIQS